MKSRFDPTKKIRQQLYLKGGGRCHFCGKPLTHKNMTVDHLVCTSRWPANTTGVRWPSNLVAACHRCNQMKRDRSLVGCCFVLHCDFVRFTAGDDGGNLWWFNREVYRGHQREEAVWKGMGVYGDGAAVPEWDDVKLMWKIYWRKLRRAVRVTAHFVCHTIRQQRLKEGAKNESGDLA